jgi:hypothetical protein
MTATRINLDVTAAYRILLATTGALLVPLATSGCSAGQTAQISQDIVTD